ncbi:MAG: hypothetical protein K8S23_05970 [Candidatus Cloacimonetes bacterium]|nr:hypothetical protein [Candidatus Cloacimonadota bacterium]
MYLLSWEQIGPSSIKGRDIIVDKSTTIIYVLSFDNMHLYKIDEELNLWEEIIIPAPSNKVSSFDVFDNKIYLTKDGYLYISEDGGYTWNEQYFNNGCYNVFILKNQPNIIFFLRYGNVWFRSIDYGYNWIDLGNMWCNTLLYNEEYSTVCLTGSSNEFYRSNDLGENWEQYDSPFYSMGFIPKSGIILNEDKYIVGGVNINSSPLETIFLTQNGGIDWECINYGSQFELLGNSIVQCWDTIIISSVRVSFNMNNLSGLFKLDQENQIWEEIGSGLEIFIEGPEIYSNQNILYWSTKDEGIFIFDNIDSSVNLIPQNIFRKDILNIDFLSENPSSIFTSFGCLYISNDTVPEWERIDSALYNKSLIRTNNLSNEWLACRENGLFISDNGEYWIETMDGIDLNDRINLKRLYKLDSNILCFGVDYTNYDSFIYQSIDSGVTWNKILEGNENYSETSISLMNTVKVDDIHLGIFYKKGIYSTSNLGETWEPFYTFDDSYYYFKSYYNEEYFYLLCQKTDSTTIELFRTSDFLNWIECTQEFSSETGITDIAFDPNNQNKIFASIRSLSFPVSEQPHLMISENSGDTWNEYYIDNLDSIVDIRNVITSFTENKIYIIPIDNSILSYNLDELSSSINTLNITDESIFNYPNPFNPETTISFHLKGKDIKNVKIEIFNIKGQRIKKIEVLNTKFGIIDVRR